MPQAAHRHIEYGASPYDDESDIGLGLFISQAGDVSLSPQAWRSAPALGSYWSPDTSASASPVASPPLIPWEFPALVVSPISSCICAEDGHEGQDSMLLDPPLSLPATPPLGRRPKPLLSGLLQPSPAKEWLSAVDRRPCVEAATAEVVHGLLTPPQTPFSLSHDLPCERKRRAPPDADAFGPVRGADGRDRRKCAKLGESGEGLNRFMRRTQISTDKPPNHRYPALDTGYVLLHKLEALHDEQEKGKLITGETLGDAIML